MLADNEQLPRLLLDCLHQEQGRVDRGRLAGLAPADWQSLLALAGQQKLSALLYHRLKTHGLGPAVPAGALDSLRKAYWLAAQRNLTLLGELHRIITVLNAQGIPSIVLKGAFLAAVVYESLGLREMSDLDLLVAPRDLDQTAAILQTQGYTPGFILPTAAALARKHHLPRFAKPDVAMVEVHWNIIQPDKAYSIDPSGLWERARPARIAGVGMLGLCPEDVLLHLCAHLSYVHVFAFGLRPLCDIAEVIAYFDGVLDWSQVVERAQRWRWERGVYLALRLAKELVGAVAPDDALLALHSDDISPMIIAAAASQLLTDPTMTDAAPASLARLWSDKGARGSASSFLRSVFPPRKRMAALYALPPDSARVYWCYAMRIGDMVKGSWRTVLALGRGDPALGSMVERKAELLSWLERKN